MVSSTALNFVLQSPWGAALTPAQADRVGDEMCERHVQPGAPICHSGAQVIYWKGVVHGLVKMSLAAPDGRTSTLAGLAAGAWFGEGPVLRSETWDFDGVAMRDTHLVLLPRSTFQWLVESNPTFNRFVMAQLSERLAQFLAIIEAERLETAETRVARCLGWLFNPVLYPGVGSRLELSQQEIGYLSGVTRQRVNQALRAMERVGLLVAEYGAVQVLDLDGLLRFRG